jgi:internalin A
MRDLFNGALQAIGRWVRGDGFGSGETPSPESTEYARREQAGTLLNLADQKLSTLPPEVCEQGDLQELFLGGNNLSSLPSKFANLKNLRTLGLNANKLSVFPPEIRSLRKLERLGLHDNALSEIPAWIHELPNLRELWLHNNRLNSLPTTMISMRQLKVLYLHGNSELGLPDEILGPDGISSSQDGKPPRQAEDILNYYFRIRPIDKLTDFVANFQQPSSVQVREARLIVIGDGQCGKTSLIRALLYDSPAREGEDTTRDVVVCDWPNLELVEPTSQSRQKVAVHVWDFGGQEPMHAAHPYFFTNRTLYLVVATAREVGVEERISYWLKMVTAHGQGARALVAVNKVDQHAMDIKARELCAFHQLNLPADPKQAFFPTSCREGAMSGIERLRQRIIEELQAMDQIWSYVPSEWMGAKRQIERARTENRDTLTFNEWEAICDRENIDGRERPQALSLLRDLGSVVTFPDDDRLSALGVLNPSWVTRAVYPLLTSSELAIAKGLLRRDDLARLLKDSKRYPFQKHAWLIDLMKKFELLFENENRLLLPARLPKDVPEWALEPRWSEPDLLHLEFRFKVLPENVISKFITRWHEDAWKDDSWWRHGIAVKQADCFALVRAHIGDPGRIDLKVGGPKFARQQFVAEIRADLRKLTQKLDAEFWVVLGGVHAEKYDDLLILVHAGERTIRRVVAGQMRQFDLVKELDLIEPASEQQRAFTNVVVIGGDAKGSAFGSGAAVENLKNYKPA